MERIGSEDVGTERALPFHGLLHRGPPPGPSRAGDVRPAGAAGSVRASAHERLALLRRLHAERRAHASLAPPDLVRAAVPRAHGPLAAPALGRAAHRAPAPLASPVLVLAAAPRAAARG